MSLGTVIHSVASESGAIPFRATEEWEATEDAPGGCGGAKEVISETWARKYEHIFTPGADFKSFHEQSGKCIYGGTISDVPAINDGRAEIAIRGHGQRAERKTGQLLYQTRDLNDWMDADAARVGGLGGVGHQWTLKIREGGVKWNRPESPTLLTASPALIFQPRAILTNNTYGSHQVSRLAFSVTNYSSGGTFTLHVSDLTTDSTFAVASGATVDVDVDVDPSQTFLEIYLAYDGTHYTEACMVLLYDLRVNGIAPGDTYSVSSVARDLAQRLRVKPTDIDEFGFNALPLDFKDGESFAETFDYVAMLANARWLILDNGHKPYLDFGKFSKRIWETWDPHTPVDLLPLERYDRLWIPFTRETGEKDGVLVVADEPFREPNGYGRLRMKDVKHTSAQAQELGERLLPALYEQRWGGSAQLATVGLEGGDRQSAFFLHAGDILRVPQRRARARIARKSMTIRGVTVEFESNYAPLDSYLARKAKRQAA